ncbi:MAG TPA: molecular chaperone HtpG [Chlamydiales bacterium]|nr:molecular chaperone HtpG [Chlamydiales bacterium]
MAKGKLSIHSENILPIIKKWLYSEKDIFIRELISNSTDAISKLRIIAGRENITLNEMRIDIHIDKENKTIKIFDTGIGMTGEEIEKYIAQIAFSGAEDFIEKYESKDEKDQIIGHFGLGFFSSYMVAKKVEIHSLSYQKEAKASHWICDGSSDYELLESDKTSIGTEITLHISEDSEEYLDESKLNQIVKRFCPYLPYPIYINDQHINNKDPLYLKPASECSNEDYLSFYKELYPFEKDPVFWIHFNVDYPFNLKGILYFPHIEPNYDLNKSEIKLFCNRVFVSNDCKEILPKHLMILKGALDSPDIPLNVSRSFLATDHTVRKLASHISKKIASQLKSKYLSDKEAFIKIWKEIEIIIKLSILQDGEFYDKVKDCFLFETLNGSFVTIKEYLEQNKDKTQDKIFYVHANQKDSSLTKLYKEKNIDILLLNPYIDASVISFLEPKESCKFERIDGNLDALINSENKEEENEETINFIKEVIDSESFSIETKSFESKTLPGIIHTSEEERRFADFMKMAQNQTLPMKKSLILNNSHPLMQKALELKDTSPEMAKNLIQHLYDSTRLAQNEVLAEELPSILERSSNLISFLSSSL